MFIDEKQRSGILENEYEERGSSLVIVYEEEDRGKDNPDLNKFMQSKDFSYFLSTEEVRATESQILQSLAFDKNALNLLRPRNN
jgi:hypothetical protein